MILSNGDFASDGEISKILRYIFSCIIGRLRVTWLYPYPSSYQLIIINIIIIIDFTFIHIVSQNLMSSHIKTKNGR